MLTLVCSKQPLLELRGARGLGRIAFKAPFYCPDPNKVLCQTKAEIAQAGGITTLIGTPCFRALPPFPGPCTLIPARSQPPLLPHMTHHSASQAIFS